MIKIDVENEVNLEIFINGIPDVQEMPSEKWESFISVLEAEISQYYNQEIDKLQDV